MSFQTKILALASVALAPMPYTDKTTGEKAYIKRMTVAEREHYAQCVMNAPKGTSNATGFSLIMCDKDGNLLFGEKDIDTINQLPEDIVSDALTAFNTQSKLPDVEVAEKN